MMNREDEVSAGDILSPQLMISTKTWIKFRWSQKALENIRPEIAAGLKEWRIL